MEIEHDQQVLVGDPTVIFLHIGKTAGTTLRQVLRRNFRASQVMLVRVHGRPREETLDRFAALPEAMRARPRLLVGHTVYGLHEFVPRPSVYISMVRKPFSLVLSQYRFVLRTPGHRHHEIVTSKRMSIGDYVKSGISMEMDNSQTRAIAGDRSTPFGGCSNEMLETAKRHIDRSFAVVGLTERFDESLILLRKMFGWSKLHYVSANVAPREPLEISDEVRDLIEEHNRLDNELYLYVDERFDEASARYPTFEEELIRFQRANARYRPLGNLMHTVPRSLSTKLGLRRVLSRTSAPSI